MIKYIRACLTLFKEDVTSNDMACNVNGNKVPSGVQTVEAKAGDTIKVQWDQSSHPGPITHFLSDPEIGRAHV